MSGDNLCTIGSSSVSRHAVSGLPLIAPVFLMIVFGIVMYGSYLSVVHGVQHVFHPAAQLGGWPDGDRRTRLVFIVRDLEEQPIRDLFAAFMNAPAIDRPDRAALLDNPLVPFGGVDR